MQMNVEALDFRLFIDPQAGDRIDHLENDRRRHAAIDDGGGDAALRERAGQRRGVAGC